MDRRTTIWLSVDMAEALRAERKAHDSYDDVIRRLLAEVRRAREVFGSAEEDSVSIDVRSFLDFCKRLVGQNLLTAGGRGRFLMTKAEEGKLEWQVLSSGKTRHSTQEWISRVLERYEQTRSLRPVDYRDITVNASYTLALLRMYLDSGSRPNELGRS